MTREQELIVELYGLVRKVIKAPSCMVRRGGIGGQDQYAGMSPLARHESIITSNYEQEIRDAYRAKEVADAGVSTV